MYELERLGDDHSVEAFSCGNSTLDGWLQHSALMADRKGTARVYVWADEDRRVVGYVAVAPHVIERAAVPRRLGRGDPDQIPAVLIARLALDQTLHGQGLGTVLLSDVLAVVVIAAERAGGRYVVVDAIDDSAAAFYRRHGFQQGPQPNRLVLRVTDILATLAQVSRLDC